MMRTEYAVVVYVTVDHDDDGPVYSGSEIELHVVDAVTAASKGMRVDVDGELLDTEVKP
jgi:hypothetical protein